MFRNNNLGHGRLPSDLSGLYALAQEDGCLRKEEKDAQRTGGSHVQLEQCWTRAVPLGEAAFLAGLEHRTRQPVTARSPATWQVPRGPDLRLDRNRLWTESSLLAFQAPGEKANTTVVRQLEVERGKPEKRLS